jgi:hypothetical protein
MQSSFHNQAVRTAVHNAVEYLIHLPFQWFETFPHGCADGSELCSSLPPIRFPVPKSGMGAAINCISELVHRLLELVDLLEQASRMTSVLILSLLGRCILVGRGDVAGRWCAWRAAERSGHGMAAMSP